MVSSINLDQTSVNKYIFLPSLNQGLNKWNCDSKIEFSL